MSRSKGVRACASCPMRSANFGKPNPGDWTADDDRLDWYTLENIERVWTGTQTEAALLQCHCTVGDHAPHVGKTAKPGKVALCYGHLFLASQHVSLFGEILEAARKHGVDLTPKQSMAIYRRHAGPRPLTADSMLELTAKLVMHPFFGGLGDVVPESWDGRELPAYGLPWPDPLSTQDGLAEAVQLATLDITNFPLS